MRIAVWGDGSVGRGLAVALSRIAEVVMVGPDGSGRGTARMDSTGALEGSAVVDAAESADRPGADLVLMAVKAYDLASALRDASGAPHILCLCNGMGLEAEIPPPARKALEYGLLTYGFRSISGNAVETTPGSVFITAGSVFEEVLGEAGLALNPVDDIMPVRWAKWVVNSVINPLGAITGLTNDRLLPSGLAPLVETLEDELLEVVPGEYRTAAGEMAESMLGHLLTGSRNRCSMLQDVEAGRPTEIDYLTGLCARRLPGRCPTAFALSSLVGALEADHSP
jgi:2-dehydropantoate 2-reductase